MSVEGASRPLPWTDLLAAIGEPRFALIRDALAQAGVDDLDRDRFLLNGTVGSLLKEFVPGDAPAGAVLAYGGLLHMLCAAWARDWPVAALDAAALKGITAAPAALAARTPPAAVCYVQLPEHLVWAVGAPGEPHEPLDGVFVIAEPERVRALAVLGFRPGRLGFTTLDAALPLPAPAPGPRPDGSAAYASTLPGGERAGLVSLADQLELVALGMAGIHEVEG